MATADATSSADSHNAESASGGAAKSDARSKWADPRVPIGNGPPMPKWPLVASWTAWVLWVGFLIAMLLAG